MYSFSTLSANKGGVLVLTIKQLNLAHGRIKTMHYRQTKLAGMFEAPVLWALKNLALSALHTNYNVTCTLY